MSKNIEININTGSGYEALYPKTLGSLINGVVANATNAVNADTLTSTLAVTKGGTGVTSIADLATSLNSYFAKNAKIRSYKGTNTAGEITIPYNTGTKCILLHTGTRAIYTSVNSIYNVNIPNILFILSSNYTTINFPATAGYRDTSNRVQVGPKYIGNGKVVFSYSSGVITVSQHKIYFDSVQSWSGNTITDNYFLNRDETYYYVELY